MPSLPFRPFVSGFAVATKLNTQSITCLFTWGGGNYAFVYGTLRIPYVCRLQNAPSYLNSFHSAQTERLFIPIADCIDSRGLVQ